MRISRTKQTTAQLDTWQRRLLLSIIQEAGKHLDAKELYRRATAKDTRISLATVYRNLRLFKEQGLINARRLGQAHCYYEIGQSGEHQHLVCQACGEVIEFNSSQIRKLVAEVQRKNGFFVTKVDLCLEGYCHKCNDEKR
jgi:Fur family ferric uptake transcriptional regulator